MIAGGATCGERHLDAAHLRALLDASADWLWETDGEHRFVWFSSRFQRHTGIDPATVIGRSRFEFLKNVARTDESAASHLDDLEAHRPFTDFIYESAEARREARWVSISGIPLFTTEGAFTGYRGVGRNVTGIAAATEELAQHKLTLAREEVVRKLFAGGDERETHAQRLLAALNVMDDAFCYYDRDDRLVLYNEALLKLYRGLEDIIRPGVAFSEIVDTGLARGVMDPGELSVDEWRASVMEERTAQEQTQSTFRLGDGRWVMRRTLRTDDGGLMAFTTDISALKRHEARMERAKAEADAARVRLQTAIDALKDGFVLWDRDDRLIACNKAFRRQFGFLPDLREGRSYPELILDLARSGLVPEADDREEEWARQQVESREREIGEEILFQTHDGRWMMRRDEVTNTGDRVGIRSDVTEMKHREEELAAANEHAQATLSDLKRSLDAMRMGVVVLDSNLDAEIINRAFFDIWRLQPGQVEVGSPFRALMDVNRNNGIYDVGDADWEDYVGSRLGEIRRGDVEPREFRRADGCTMIYSVTSLSGGKRLVCYYDISEQKRRETELGVALEQAKLSEAVLNGVTNPIFVKDSSLTFVGVNKAFAALFGLQPDDMIGKRGADFVPESDARSFEESERHVLATGEVYEVEEDFDFSGIGKSRLVRKNKVRTDSGNDYVACTIFDITELRRREQEAEQARLHLASVLDSLPTGVIIYDRDDRFVLANKELRDTLAPLAPVWVPGKSFREAVEYGHSIGFFRSSGDEEIDALYDTDYEAWCEAYMGRHLMQHSEFERRNPDGRWYHVVDTRAADGTFIGVRVDITDMKKREGDLRESMRDNELFRNLIDNVPVAIYAKRPDLRLIYVNQGWSDLTGYGRDFAVGKTDIEIFGTEGEDFTSGDLAVLNSGATHEVEEIATRPDGSVHHQIARKSAMIASDGSLYLIGSTTDITELKERERELEEAQQRAVLADRAKSEFLANMSHEIRTPMNGVLGMAELLAKSPLNPKQKTFTDIIVKSGNALLTIINDILDFSKIDAGQLILDPAPFNLAEAIEDVATLVSTRAKEKDLELIVRIDPVLQDHYVGDVGRIRQIVTNLLGNAVKFTDRGHVLVDVTGERRGDTTDFRYSVTDTGIGIPAEKLASVFEKFSQVDGSSTRRHEGTGLGLAIASRLVALMGGEMGVESTEGKGSTFWFTMTMKNAGIQGGRRVTPLDVTGARVLVVDDNAVNRTILTEQMNSWTFDSCAAESGPEGLKVLETAASFGLAVDCVVLDYQMPGMTGVDVARHIQANPLISGTPIVLLTSVDQALSNISYRDLGIDAQLIKPARSSALLETIVAAIQRRRASVGGPSVLAEAAVRSLRREEPAPEQPAVRIAKPDPAAYRLDILVAEDNEVNQLVFTQILSETGLTFQIVGNGRLAVEAWTEMKPRMILMDVSMPEMNGLQATGAIREAESGSGGRTPIIGVTAHALKGDRERCIEAGMDDYLSKPISPRTLLDKVERWANLGGERQRDAG
ncbi:MAG: PAS-domain containing protein [Rhizobiaceae bacterium]